ncbi:MAG: DotU family type IV/VI secretion system protein [Myxococcales bacterium]|nr:DotU family type IV/VI secretion system protein [Myxococcales bacterium]
MSLAGADDPRLGAERLARPVLAAIEVLATIDPRADAAALERARAGVMGALEGAEAAIRGRFGGDAATASKYALAALADEVALREAGPLREHWRPRSLQLHYFQDNRAGYGFFERLAALEGAASGAGRDLALAIYVLALGLGFQGRHADAAEGAAALRRHLEGARRALAAGDSSGDAAALRAWRRAPRSGLRRPPPTLGAGGRWLALAALLFVIGLFVEARCALGSMRDEASAAIGERAGLPRV